MVWRTGESDFLVNKYIEIFLCASNICFLKIGIATYIFITSEIFMANSKGYPVLSHQHQQVVLKFMDLGAQVIINGDLSQNSTPKEHVWFREYINYIRDKVVSFYNITVLI